MAAALALTQVGGLGCQELSTPPPPRCHPGQHLSGGQCCAAGREWVPARSQCVCVARDVCGDRRPLPAATATAAAADSRGAARDVCVGVWEGRLRNSEGLRGSATVTVEPLQPGTVRQPYSKTCGQLAERWGGGSGPCRARLTQCSRNGPLLIARGVGSEDTACEGPITVVVSCAADSEIAEYRRTEEGMVATGKLRRQPAASSAPTSLTPAR